MNKAPVRKILRVSVVVFSGRMEIESMVSRRSSTYVIDIYIIKAMGCTCTRLNEMKEEVGFEFLICREKKWKILRK